MANDVPPPPPSDRPKRPWDPFASSALEKHVVPPPVQAVPVRPSAILNQVEAIQKERWGARAKFAGVIISAVLAGGGAVYEVLDARVQHQIDRTLEARAHMPLEDSDHRLNDRLVKMETSLKALEQKVKGNAALSNQVHELRSDLFALYKFRVGDKAAELERRAPRRAKASELARTRFERYVNNDHDDFNEAYIKALGGARFF
jgi:hypothetical protein